MLGEPALRAEPPNLQKSAISIGWLAAFLGRGKEFMETGFWQRCPNCGMEIFGLRTENHGLVVIRVAADGSLVPKDLDPALLSDADKEVVYCLNCGWTGKTEELVG